MDTLHDRVAVVTGAAGGIGRGIALACAAAGMRLVLADLDAKGLDAVAEEVSGLGAPVLPVPTDVSDARSVDALADATLAEYGAVHVVCNNAGVSTVGVQWETPLADWEWVVGVNLWGVVNGIRSFVPHLIEQDEAHIVSTSSMGGLMTGALLGPYTATKHAVVGLSKGLRAELAFKAPHVGVSVICPGEIHTEMIERIKVEPSPESAAMLDRLRAVIAEGLPPLEVGRMVIESIKSRKFWILPNAKPHLETVRTEMDELFGS
ncbi:MAG TPA: SDR family NAD(P)-dependent oxidoreductase [Acidimicrobiia bacterium]